MDVAWLKAQFGLHPEKNKTDLAKALGLEPPAISKILSGKRQIKAQEYIAMRRFFGLPTDGQRNLSATPSQSYVLEPLSGGMADNATEEAPDNWVMPASLFKNRTKAPPDQIRIFTVHGDAMLPDFRAGEQVLVDLSDITPSPPGEFVVSDGMGHMIRQCEYVPHSIPAQITLSARNEKYQSHTMPLAQAGIIGRVIAKLQWL